LVLTSYLSGPHKGRCWLSQESSADSVVLTACEFEPRSVEEPGGGRKPIARLSGGVPVNT